VLGGRTESLKCSSQVPASKAQADSESKIEEMNAKECELAKKA